MKRFNVTGVCIPSKHYMVDISCKLAQIKEMVDYGDYFTINRARQYGKTTTLSLLEEVLKNEYIVASISFERLCDESFETAAVFCRAFMRLVQRTLAFTDVSDEYKKGWLNNNVADFNELSFHITEMCKDKKIVLMIDEVDKISNNRTYLHFLGVLRDKYLERAKNKDYTFHSVILAGVYDIRNIKLKMINEGVYSPLALENKIYNSPWNIAANFKVNMSFNKAEISTMLVEYEADRNVGMDIPALADEIYNYTSGYPFLVSRICKYIDEELEKDWAFHSVQKAVSAIIRESDTLFGDLYKNLENNNNLYDLIYDILMLGRKRTYAIGSPAVDIAKIYGIIKEVDQSVVVSNRMFELAICNHFIAKDEELHKKRIIFRS